MRRANTADHANLLSRVLLSVCNRMLVKFGTPDATFPASIGSADRPTGDTIMIRTFDAFGRQAFALFAAFSVAALMIGAAVPLSPIA
jgi:hypothetical protein